MLFNQTRSDKPDEKPNFRARLAVMMLIFLLVFLFVVPYFAFEKDTDFFPIIGGVIGALSSMFVIFAYLIDPRDREPSLELLFWRSVCDLGLAVRFILNNGFNRMVCGGLTCQLTSSSHSNYSDQSNCYLASGITQLFEMASEGWLLCIGVDLYFSMTRPFSSFKSRLRYYHLFVWTYAIIYSIPTFIDESMYGFWFISTEVSDIAVCWIKLGNQQNSENVGLESISWKPWVMLYIPLVIIYAVCVGILVYAYYRLKRGIPRTIVHRMKALITNSINISIYLLYWFFVGWFYVGSYLAHDNKDNNNAKLLFSFLLYLISAKGFASIIVWITIINVEIGKSMDSTTDRLDLNSALRQEVLHFATLGIRCSANEAVNASDKINETVLKLNINGTEENTLADELTAWFFIKLVFGFRTEVQRINLMVRQTSRTFTVPTGNPSSTGNIATTGIPPFNSEPDLRLSQRPTVQSNDLNGIPSDSSESYEEAAAAVRTTSTGIAMSTIVNSTDGLTSGSRIPSVASTIEGEEDLYEKMDNSIDLPILDKIHKAITGASIDRGHVEFTEFEPHYFRRVRLAAGITDAAYISAFRTTIKERLIEGGASGAFFFLSKGEIFIAKSCSAEELETLKSSAGAFATFLEKNTNSYISRIYGAYRLRIYSSSLLFFVMNNIFLNSDDAVMHEKYDIKGSWVARSSTPPRDGQLVTCTHCEQSFRYYRKHRPKKLRAGTAASNDTANSYQSALGFVMRGTMAMLGVRDQSEGDDDNMVQSRCPYTVKGGHEPNITLKDNDLKYKIRLPYHVAINLLYQLRKDSEFLYSIGVMDFSLLVGVHNTEYCVNLDNEIDQPPASSAASETGTIRPVSIRNMSGDTSSDVTSPLHRLPLHRRNTLTRMNNASQSKITEYRTSRALHVSRIVGPVSYYLGIIDYQQKWTWSKKLERFLKIRFNGADPNGLSAIEPELYKERFIRHVEDILDIDDNDRMNSRQNTTELGQAINNV